MFISVQWCHSTEFATRGASLALAYWLSGMAKIYCGERRALELLGRRIVRYLRVEVWSWW